MDSHPLRIMMAALAFALVVAPAPAQTPSTTPYAALYQVLEPARQAAAFDRLQPLPRVESTLPGVHASAIKLVIKSRTGDIPVPVDAQGLIVFPLNDALAAENPPVQSNQPKGSLTLTLTFALKLPDTQRVAWADLDAALEQARQMIAKQLGTTTPAPVAGAEFHFAPGSNASITVSGKGERLLVADGGGRIVVMLDASVAKEKPVLLISGKPLLIIPYLRP
ncbi:MAG: hypothetical protein ABI411_04670 [Tahibacter sp.]